MCDTPMSEPRRQHPHLREAQERLNEMRGQQEASSPTIRAAGETRGLSVDSHVQELGASDHFLVRPWAVRKGQEVPV